MSVSPAPTPPALHIPPSRSPAIVHALQTALVLVIAGLLLFDRLRLAQLFLFKFSDEDQTLEWYAAHELLRGHIPEPCFYGQSFNSCLEGMLAAPLVAVHVPYWIAVPTVTVLLGLFPFLLMAWIAWRHKRYGMAALALLVPLILPVRYAMIAGMPRGFVPGIAVAILPSLLLIPASRNLDAGEEPHLAFGHPRLRFFLIGMLAIVALTLNANSSILLAGAAVYAVGTHWRNWRFWLFASLGWLIGAIYPLGAYLFYYVSHDDYRMHLRARTFGWTKEAFDSFFRDVTVPLGDFVPAGLPVSATAWIVGGAFAAVVLWLVVRRRWIAAAAGLAAIGFTILTFAYERVHEAKPSVFYPFGRMYLALPVLLVWLVLLALPRTAMPIGRWGQWLSRGVLLLALIVAVVETRYKQQLLPSQIAQETSNIEILKLIDVEQARQVAQRVQAAADSEDAHFMLLTGDGKKWDYLLPVLTDCETLFPHYERRTWRLLEECAPRYDRILVMDATLYERARAADYSSPAIVRGTPFIGAFDTDGKSVIHICQELGTDVRAFNAPPSGDLLRPIRMP